MSTAPTTGLNNDSVFKFQTLILEQDFSNPLTPLVETNLNEIFHNYYYLIKSYIKSGLD